MKLTRTITAAAASLALLGTLGLSTTAGAAVTPVMDAHETGWAHTVRTPGDVEIGQGGSPYLAHLTWQHWDGTWAGATGRLYVQNPHCTPSYLCPYHSYNVKVWLHGVIRHRGSAVFSRMRWTYGGHVLRLWVGRGGLWDYRP